MNRIAFYCFLAVGLACWPTYAGQPEARETARLNNCQPKKIEVYQQALGPDGHTVYRVQCTLPKTVGDAGGASMPDTLLISCDQNLCDFLRPVTADQK